MTSVRSVALAGAALLLTTAACGDPERAVNDSAACPGGSCTADARTRADAIGSIDGVTEVLEVTREYGLDRGSHRTAEVRSGVASGARVRRVALAVMRALEDWPGHADGGATVVVARDGAPRVTFVLDRDWVCEQPPGMRVACTAENSWTLDGQRASSLN